VPDDPYAGPATGVLRNKLGLSTSAELEAAEREITQAALMFLRDSPVAPAYDLRHLCAIHYRIFGDIYDWAGQLRTVAIAKGSWFCLPQYIVSSAADIFRALHGESCLRGLPRDAFSERLTYYLGEVNAIHPFREGNGRAQRAFFEQLASDAGFVLDWQHLDADRNVAASAAIMQGNPAPMRKMLDELIRELLGPSGGGEYSAPVQEGRAGRRNLRRKTGITPARCCCAPSWSPTGPAPTPRSSPTSPCPSCASCPAPRI
jgi:cell filamentation protein